MRANVDLSVYYGPFIVPASNYSHFTVRPPNLGLKNCKELSTGIQRQNITFLGKGALTMITVIYHTDCTSLYRPLGVRRC